jgi:hypothetical protein
MPKGRNKKETLAILAVQKFFPDVERVSDATKPIKVIVNRDDNDKAEEQKPESCAMARACRRHLKIDGAIIRLRFAYLIKGSHATRYEVPFTVRAEIVSFDRHKDFRPGEYMLSAVCPSRRMDHIPRRAHGEPMKGRKGGVRHPFLVHRVEGVRSAK